MDDIPLIQRPRDKVKTLTLSTKAPIPKATLQIVTGSTTKSTPIKGLFLLQARGLTPSQKGSLGR